ncbi:MAG: CvpA family protein [Vallitalea sp.]|jgi:uncharacterized membrane protein required for colicin V production|nr:CvpA family protein [Vallitalea sp.]
MNWLDIVVVGIIAINAIISYRRGFIKTIFSFVSLIISIFLTMHIYPHVSEFLIKHTGVYESLKTSIMGLFHLDNVSENMASAGDQINFINQLKIPEQFKNILISNNNNEVYSLLNVNDIGEYIAGLIATLIINIISFLVVFIVVSIVVKLFVNLIDLVSKLPVLHQINKMGGLIVGTIIGVIIVWILCLGISLMSTNPNFEQINEMLNISVVAKYFYENNFLMKIVTDISKSIV